jgi:hypothetical protein
MALVLVWGLQSHAAHRWVRFALSFVSKELPGMDEVQAAALQLRVLFSDLRQFDNILFRKKWNVWWVDGMRRKNTSLLKFQVQHAESGCCALFVPSFSFFLLSHAASLLAVASVPCAGSPWCTPGMFSLYFFFADFFFFSPITNPQGCNMTPPPTVMMC